MNTNDIITKTNDNIMNTYARLPISIKSGKNATVYDNDGKKYIDLTSGIGVTALGHCDQEWIDAVKSALDTPSHTSNYFYSESSALLAEQLVNITDMSKAFFCNSGAEANECAIKLARKYSFDKYGKGRSNIITLKKSFHGRTLTTLSATGQDKFHNYFFPFTEGFIFIEPELEQLKKASDNTVCAVMIECIQGEGGINVLDKKLVQKLAEFLAEHDILLIVDEVQTGIGRTGSFLAIQQYGVCPDIVTISKSLGGGLPIGATLCNEKLSKALKPGDHGSTFGANPICCAAGLALVKKINDIDFYSEITKKGEYIKEKLAINKNITNIRGMGLMIAFDIPGSAREMLSELAAKGVLCLTAGDSMRLLPALTISTEEIDEGISIIINSVK